MEPVHEPSTPRSMCTTHPYAPTDSSTPHVHDKTADDLHKQRLCTVSTAATTTPYLYMDRFSVDFCSRLPLWRVHPAWQDAGPEPSA